MSHCVIIISHACGLQYSSLHGTGPTPPPFALSDRDAGLLLVAVVVAVAAFGALSALVQEALINSLRRYLKVGLLLSCSTSKPVGMCFRNT